MVHVPVSPLKLPLLAVNALSRRSRSTLLKWKLAKPGLASYSLATAGGSGAAGGVGCGAAPGLPGSVISLRITPIRRTSVSRVSFSWRYFSGTRQPRG